jgi:hypothetical protein
MKRRTMRRIVRHNVDGESAEHCSDLRVRAADALLQTLTRKTTRACTRLHIQSKGKVHPGTGHEGPDGEYRYSSTLSLTSALDGSAQNHGCKNSWSGGNDSVKRKSHNSRLRGRRFHSHEQEETLVFERRISTGTEFSNSCQDVNKNHQYFRELCLKIMTHQQNK